MIYRKWGDGSETAEELPTDGRNGRNIQGEDLILGSDGKFYPPHTKTISGLRPTAGNTSETVDVDPVVEIDGSAEVLEVPGENTVETESIRTRRDLAQFFDDKADEIPTSPDLGALMDQARLYDKARKEMFEPNAPKTDEGAGEDLTRLVSDAEMSALNVLNTITSSQIDPKSRWLQSAVSREIKILERTKQPDDIPWWVSNSSVVRLWGQLNCGFQVFEDMQLVKDLVDVLGKEWLDLDPPVGGEMIAFVYMTQHTGNLKKEIRQKYPELENLFDAIVKKQHNEE